jgi:hypothetical protein
VIKKITLISAVLTLSACASTQVTRVQPLDETADAPYENVLVVSLFASFDVRRTFETAVVRLLKDRGVQATASTSMMNTKTPVTRQTFLAMVESQRSDSVLVTQLVNLETVTKEKDARPESTYIIRPTYYYDVWSVELTEYVAPPILEFNHTMSLATQVYSAVSKEPVWGIESKTKLSLQREEHRDPSIIINEAKSIVSYLSRDGLLSP